MAKVSKLDDESKSSTLEIQIFNFGNPNLQLWKSKSSTLEMVGNYETSFKNGFGFLTVQLDFSLHLLKKSHPCELAMIDALISNDNPYHPCMAYLPTFTIIKSTIHVGKYTKPMDPMGKKIHGWGCRNWSSFGGRAAGHSECRSACGLAVRKASNCCR